MPPAEALHLAHLVAAHGYFFPIDDHVLTVKNDSTFYRFQVRRLHVGQGSGTVVKVRDGSEGGTDGTGVRI